MPPQQIDIEHLKEMMVCKKTGSLWIFGYASLIWKPGFPYKRRHIGYIKGYSRRFFQGTTTHRGTVEWPGRVATMLRHEGEEVWGVAYEVNGPEEIAHALEHLAEREMITGGYRFDQVQFYPADPEKSPIIIQVYVAEKGNKQYLGDASLQMQAYQIAHSHGVCGSNSEYVRKVADFMRNEVPEGENKDAYLFQLVTLIEEFEAGSRHISRRQLKKLPMRVEEASVDHTLKEFKLLEENVPGPSLTS